MAKAKHSLARKSDIKAGKTIWIVDVFGLRRVTIKQRTYNSYGDVKTLNLNGSYDMHAYNAVIGLAYDHRPCQVFTNRKAAQWWNDYWKSNNITNPNFVIKNPHNNQIAYVEMSDYMDGYQ